MIVIKSSRLSRYCIASRSTQVINIVYYFRNEEILTIYPNFVLSHIYIRGFSTWCRIFLAINLERKFAWMDRQQLKDSRCNIGWLERILVILPGNPRYIGLIEYFQTRISTNYIICLWRFTINHSYFQMQLTKIYNFWKKEIRVDCLYSKWFLSVWKPYYHYYLLYITIVRYYNSLSRFM